MNDDLGVARLRGAAAIAEMLNLIGNTEADRDAAAKILCEHELDIREAVHFVIASCVQWDDPLTRDPVEPSEHDLLVKNG